MKLDKTACYRALQTRDARFDGRFFTGVHTTGIYCRPICPARCPKLENITFYASAAAAQEAGFRPCLRCRPETSPSLAAWRGTSNTVRRALALMAEGALDSDTAGVESLAIRLGIGERQLRRLFKKHLGASPIAVSQTRRVLFAKQLIHESDMSMANVAMAAGFGSVRRFNDTFLQLYGRPPSELRRKRSASAAPERSGTTLTLSYAAPYDWAAMLEHLRAQAIAGVELVEPERYRRTIALDGCHGTIEVVRLPQRDALAATIRFAAIQALPAIVARIRCIFDLAADSRAIVAQLAQDPTLCPLVNARPGLRVPGAWDGFELAVRAILGQRIPAAAAQNLLAKLVASTGEVLAPSVLQDHAELSHVFPTPERLARADLNKLGIPSGQAKALTALARAAAADATLFQREALSEFDAAVARMREIPGIDEWTAQYIALRALRDPDAFPATDAALLSAAAGANSAPLSPAALLARAEAWRPWRGYAAEHLWTQATRALAAAPSSQPKAVA